MKKATIVGEFPKNIPEDLEKKPVDIIMTEDNGNYIIDTCLCPHTKSWETKIFLDNKEEGTAQMYSYQEDAVKGHKKWVERIKENPKDIW